MNKTIIFSISLSIVAIALAIALGVYVNQPETIKAHTHPGHLTLEELDYDTVRELKEDLGQIETNRLNNVYDAGEIKKINKHANANATKLQELQGLISIVEAQEDVTTMPKQLPTINTADFQLTITDSKGGAASSLQSDGTVLPLFSKSAGLAILIQGTTEFPQENFQITITDPNGDTVKDRAKLTFSDGDISEAWIPDERNFSGVYKITIRIKAISDSIFFELK